MIDRMVCSDLVGIIFTVYQLTVASCMKSYHSFFNGPLLLTMDVQTAEYAREVTITSPTVAVSIQSDLELPNFVSLPSASPTPGLSITIPDAADNTIDEIQSQTKEIENDKLLFLSYALISINEGGLETLSSSLFTNISEQLSISELQTSYIMLCRSISYVAATFLTAFVLDRFRATHLYFGGLLIIGAICCCAIPFIQEYSAHFVMWSVLGMCSGTMDVSLPVYAYRRWPKKATNYYLALLVIYGIAKLVNPLLIQLSVQISGEYGFTLFMIAGIALSGSFIALCLDTPQHDKFRFDFCIFIVYIVLLFLCL